MPGEQSLVITESAIEALSYHAIYHPDGARYFSIAGKTNLPQRQLLKAAFLKLPPGASGLPPTTTPTGGIWPS